MNFVLKEIKKLNSPKSNLEIKVLYRNNNYFTYLMFKI